MRAISLWPGPAADIFMGLKEIEFRSWKTNHRGPLLICSTQGHAEPFTIPGHAVAVVDVVDMKKAGPGEWGWILDNIRLIKPFPVKGKQGFMNIDDDLIEYCPEDLTPEELDQWINNNYFSKMVYIEQDEDGNWRPTKEAIEKFGSPEQ